MRRRGVRGVLGEDVLGLLAAKVNIRGREWSEPADWGGVNVNEVAVGLGSVWRGGCVLVVGVKLGYAELGVSGYVIEKGPGVWVRCEGWTCSLSPGKLLVSSRNDVRLVNLVSIDVERGLAVLGEAFSIATITFGILLRSYSKILGMLSGELGSRAQKGRISYKSLSIRQVDALKY